MYIKKRGKKWLAEAHVMINYQRIRDYKTFDTKAEAVAWATERERELRAGKIETHDDKTFRDALTAYIEEEVPKKKKEIYIKNTINRIAFFMKCPALDIDVKLQSLDYAVFEKYIDYRLNVDGVVTSTVNKELTLMRAAIRSAQKKGWLTHNPFEHIKQLKEPPARNRRITDEEIEIILESLGYREDEEPVEVRQRVAIMFLFALETGMRIGEICNLEWNDIYFEERYLTIRETKNNDPRDVPLSLRAIELLMKVQEYSKKIEYFKEVRDQYGRKMRYHARPVFYQNQTGKDPGNASNLFKKYVRKAGIYDITFHDTRHEACTRLARKIDVLDLAKMIGHRDPRSLMIYYNPTPTEIANRLD